MGCMETSVMLALVAAVLTVTSLPVTSTVLSPSDKKSAAAVLSAYKMKVTVLHSLLRAECPQWADQYQREIERRQILDTNIEIVKILYHRLENRLLQNRDDRDSAGRRSKLTDNLLLESADETTTLTYLLEITQPHSVHHRTPRRQSVINSHNAVIPTHSAANTVRRATPKPPNEISTRIATPKPIVTHQTTQHMTPYPHHTTYVLPTMQVLTMATIRTKPTLSIIHRTHLRWAILMTLIVSVAVHCHSNDTLLVYNSLYFFPTTGCK